MGDWLRELEVPQRRLLAAIATLLIASMAALGATALSEDGGDAPDTAARLETDDEAVSSTSTSSTTTSTTTLAPVSSTTVTTVTTVAATTPTTRRRGPATTQPAPGTTAPPVTTAPPATVPSGDRDTASESTIATLFAAHRAGQGLPAMTRDPNLDEVAARWARVMANTQTLAHDTKGTRRVEIMNACPTPCSGWAENVGYSPTAAEVWTRWVSSSGHLANLQDGHGGYYGVAAYRSGDFVWISHVFGRTG